MPAAGAGRALLLALAFLALPAAPAAAGDDAAPLALPVPRLFAPEGLALGGHDAVAYFTESRAVAGLPEHALRWRGAVWRFASAANLAAFERDPTAYAPAFGGYCAAAMSRGIALPADPARFAVIGGRLYLAHDAEALARLLADPEGVIAAAAAAWPALHR